MLCGLTAATVATLRHCCRLQTPEGEAPDVWQRLPGEGLTRALQQLTRGEESVPELALHSLAAAVSEHSLHVEATCKQLQRAHDQEVKAREGLQQQVAVLTQQVAQQREEVADLRAELAEMRAQMKSLLQQKEG